MKRYSSGMFARLGFSVAAHVDPEVLIVDEVLSVGDYLFQQKCVERMKEVIRNGATVLFVSHNLKSVSEFCDRCMLLDKGRGVMTGPATEVISAYLNQFQKARIVAPSSGPVTISKVRVRNEYGECIQFRSGQKAWIDVELTARRRCSRLSVTLYITDDTHDSIFDASTERLGHGNFTLDEGDVFACTFEVQLNMVAGIFHPSILIYRYDTQTAYDRWEPATTIYVNSADDVAGIVHCFPKLLCQEIHAASDIDVATTAGPNNGGTNLH